MFALCRCSVLTFACLLLLFATPASPQEREVAAKLRELRRVQLVDGIGYVVPPDARPLLKSLKHDLRDLITQFVRAQADQLSAPQLRAKVLSRLRRSRVRLGGGINSQTGYGGIWAISVVRPVGHVNLVAVSTKIGIACGEDSSLYIFERRDLGWELTLALESNDYEAVNGALGNFGFAVSPVASDGSWFVVAANTSPWCTSNWNAIHYRALQPGKEPYEPIVLLDATAGVYLGVDEPYRLSIRRDGFQIAFVATFDLDQSQLTRVHVLNYTAEDRRFRRIPPFAVHPEEFVDEWSSLPWEEAARLSSSSDMVKLEEWHKKLGNHPAIFPGFLFAQPCRSKGGSENWLLGLGLDEKPPATLYFSVVREGEVFKLVDISRARPAGCPGERLPRSHLTRKLP